jgi:hypothetical protein
MEAAAFAFALTATVHGQPALPCCLLPLLSRQVLLVEGEEGSERKTYKNPALALGSRRRKQANLSLRTDDARARAPERPSLPAG